MARRGHEGPMEFEWQNAPPADVTSPFYQLTVKHQEEQRRLYGTKRGSIITYSHAHLNLTM